MNYQYPMVPLGFTEDQVPAGTHICQIYTDDDDRSDSLLKFLLSGLQSRERAACFSEKISDQALGAFLERHQMSYDRLSREGALVRSDTREVYFQDNCFDPDRMLDLLRQFYHESMDAGYTAARVIGEMTPDVQEMKGGDRLLEYESRVSLLLEECPVTAVCQYDAREFDGAAIMDILKVHPLMVIRGAVTHNPFFIPPEEFLD